MHKLTLIFHHSDDDFDLETKWSHEFVPRAEKMPGIRRVAVSRVAGSPSGQVDISLIHEIYFDDLKSLTRALASPEGQEAGRALMSFASDNVTVCYAEHLQEDR